MIEYYQPTGSFGKKKDHFYGTVVSVEINEQPTLVLDTGHFLGPEDLIWRKLCEINNTTICVHKKGYFFTQLGHFSYQNDIKPASKIISTSMMEGSRVLGGKIDAIITKSSKELKIDKFWFDNFGRNQKISIKITKSYNAGVECVGKD